MPRSHYLKDAFFDGLNLIDTDEMLSCVAEHTTLKGEWLHGVVSPSLTANECRLARLKIFLGDDPQPGFKRMAVRAGQPDSITQLNFLRGFMMEGVVVTALKQALGSNYIMGHAPTLVFKWRYKGDDIQLSMWGQGMTFMGHPDMMIWNQAQVPELELVQIKAPSIFKFERAQRLGDQDVLKSYRAQMATEMYIGRRMGYPIRRSHLMMVSWEGSVKIDNPHCRVTTMEWDESLATIPEQVARELIEDYDRAYTLGQWPEPFPEHRADTWPCSYCKFGRLPNRTGPSCTEQWAWDLYNDADERTQKTGSPAPDLTRILEFGRTAREPMLADANQETRRVRPRRVAGKARHGSSPQLRVVRGANS